MLPATATEPMSQKYRLKKACRDRLGKSLIRRYLQAGGHTSSPCGLAQAESGMVLAGWRMQSYSRAGMSSTAGRHALYSVAVRRTRRDLQRTLSHNGTGLKLS